MSLDYTVAFIEDSVRTYVTGSQFISNMAQKGGGVYANSSGSNDIKLSWLLISENQADEGGGIYLVKDGSTPIYLEHSKIMFNYAKKEGGGISVLIAYFKVIKMYIHFTNIIGNTGDIGSAVKLKLQEYSTETCANPSQSGSLWLKSVAINSNSIHRATLSYGAAAVHVSFVHQLFLEDTSFYNNTGGGVYTNNSDIILIGRIVFEHNYGHSGGAIQLDSYTDCGRNSYPSFLQLMSSSHIIITNNRALEYGGGIGISERRSDRKFCFYTIGDTNRDPHGFIEMKANHAETAGDDIYGVSTKQCQLYVNSNYASDVKIEFDSIFKGLYSTLSSVTSTPYHVCFCNEAFDSPNKHCLGNVEVSTFLGQDFNISAVAVGNYRGVAPAVVHTQFNAFGASMELGTRQQVQNLGRTCGELTYSVKTLVSFIQLHLTVEGISRLRVPHKC